MRFAYHATMCNPEFYLPLAIAAEEVGFDTFTLPDSICYPEVSDSKYPYNGSGDREFLDGVPFLEPFSLVLDGGRDDEAPLQHLGHEARDPAACGRREINHVGGRAHEQSLRLRRRDQSVAR